MTRLILARYETLETLGVGGQGHVVKALDHQHDRLVALKVRSAASAAGRESLLAEARALIELEPHPSLPVIRDDFFEGECYYLVMEWVRGPTLRRLLDERGRPGLPVAEAIGYLSGVAEALDHLHGSSPPVVHGDVKPENVIVTKEGRGVLVDLGAARRSDLPGGGASGTSGYAAPEIMAGASPAPPSDVYALSATMFTLITGSPPSPGVRWRLRGPREQRALVLAALRRGLAFDPDRRPASAGLLVASMRAATPAPTNLPLQIGRFVGRAPQVGEVTRLLASEPLVTLTGPGGVGKTRLALEVGAEALSRYPDGVWFVELQAARRGAEVAAAAAAALGIPEQPGRSVADGLRGALLTRQLLIVLDNCEHLAEDCAEFAESLLGACAGVHILATSRAPLGLPGEVVWRVPSLSVPSEGPLGPEQLLAFEAPQLFVERARRRSSSFRLTVDNAQAVGSVCRRLDGIPLALELAAARVASLSPAAMLERLDDRFGLLGVPRGAGAPRHRTLRATFDWSFDLLSQPERVLFRRLGVFRGGFLLDAVDNVCQGGELQPRMVLDLLGRLVDRSLVQTEELDGETRYDLLETIREYAWEKLAESEEMGTVRSRHLEWFLDLAARADSRLGGEEQRPWLERLDVEHDNLRAALEWGVSCVEGRAIALATSLHRFWDIRGCWAEGRRWLREARACARTRDGVVARALGCEASFARSQGDLPAARALYEEGLALRRELGDERGIAGALNGLASVSWAVGDFASARSLSEESLRLYEDLGDRQGAAEALNGLGGVAWAQADCPAARVYFERALSLRRALGDKRGSAASLTGLGGVWFLQGDYGAARASFEESLALRRELGDRRGVAESLGNVASVAIVQGDAEAAGPLLEEGSAICRKIGDDPALAGILKTLADAERALGRPSAARGLLEESAALCRRVGDRRRLGNALYTLGELVQSEGDVGGGRALLSEALAMRSSIGDRMGIVECLEALADSAAGVGHAEHSTRLLAAAEALRETIGAPSPASGGRDRAVAAARSLLGEETFRRSWAEGRRLDVREAVAEALASR